GSEVWHPDWPARQMRKTWNRLTLFSEQAQCSQNRKSSPPSGGGPNKDHAMRKYQNARTGCTAMALMTLAGAAMATPPQYTSVDMGVVNAGDFASQGFRVSPGGVGTGRSIAAAGSAAAFTWTLGGGTVGLPNLTSPARPYSVGNGVNDNGQVVGTGS